MLTAHEVLGYTWLWWRRYADRIPGHPSMAKGSRREPNLLSMLATEAAFPDATPDDTDTNRSPFAFGFDRTTNTVWFRRAHLTHKLRKVEKPGIDESKILVDPKRPFLSRLAYLEQHVPEQPEDPTDPTTLFVRSGRDILRKLFKVDSSRMRWFGPVHAEYANGILSISISPGAEVDNASMELVRRLESHHPRLQGLRSRWHAIPLRLGAQYFPGIKQSTAITYHGLTNEVVITGRCEDDAPSFGANFSQPIHSASTLLIRADVRRLGTTQWGRAFFRVDVDDQDERRCSLDVTEPMTAASKGDAYVQQPEKQPTTITYRFALPSGMRTLRRLQVVLAANDAYDVTFSDFALLEPTGTNGA